MDQQTITVIAVIVIVLMGAMLVGAEVAQNLRLERQLDEKEKRDELEVGQGEFSDEGTSDEG